MSDRSICVTELLACVVEELLDAVLEEVPDDVSDVELSALSAF